MKKTQLENYFFGWDHFGYSAYHRKKYQLQQKIKKLFIKIFILCFITAGLGVILSLQSCKDKEADQVILTEGQKLQLFILKQPILFK